MTKLSFTLLCFIFAYPHTFYPQNLQNDPYKELEKEINHYTKTHIEPLLRIQREKMDKYLTTNDLEALNQLRAEYHSLKIEKNQIFDQYRGQGSKVMQAWHNLRNRESDIWQKALQISYQYQSQVNTLLNQEIAADKRLWRMEMNLIVNKYNSKLENHQIALFKKHDFGDFMTPAGFLLWNIPKIDTQGAEASPGPEEFPNPTLSKKSIQFSLQQEEQVIISLLDNQKRLIKILLNDTLAAGKHQIKVLNTDFPGNVYFYKVSKTSGTEIKKIVND